MGYDDDWMYDYDAAYYCLSLHVMCVKEEAYCLLCVARDVSGATGRTILIVS